MAKVGCKLGQQPNACDTYKKQYTVYTERPVADELEQIEQNCLRATIRSAPLRHLETNCTLLNLEISAEANKKLTPECNGNTKSVVIAAQVVVPFIVAESLPVRFDRPTRVFRRKYPTFRSKFNHLCWSATKSSDLRTFKFNVVAKFVFFYF